MNTGFLYCNFCRIFVQRVTGGLAVKFPVVAALVVILAGCATATPKPPVAYNSIAERQQDLAALQVWSATGRIALSSPAEGFSAAMDWRQINSDYDVELTALFGQRALRVTQQGARAQIEARGRPSVMGRNAEELLLNELGVRVPLSQMAFWIKGLPGNLGEPAYDEAGRLQKLSYVDADGTQWVADFKRFKRFNDLELPALIDMKGQDYSIRLLIKNWKIVPSASQPVKPPEPTVPTPQKPPPGRLQIPSA